MRNNIKNNLKILSGIVGGAIISNNASAQAESTQRAYELPQKNTIHVGSSILGVASTIEISAGQEYSFDVNTEPGFNKEHFPLKVKAYDSFETFVKDVEARIRLYGNDPKLKSRVDRDRVALKQIKDFVGYHASSKDSLLQDKVLESLKDMRLTEVESYNLARIVNEKGYKNALVPVMIYHEGYGKTPGESIPMMLNIAHLVQGPGKIEYRDRQDNTQKADTAKNNKPCPQCPPCPKDSAKNDTIKKKTVPKNNLQFYIGGGAEDNKTFGLVSQGNLGMNIGKTYIGLLFGYGKGFTNNSSDIFPDAQGQGYTKIDTKKIVSDMFQPGIEFGYDITKNFKINLGAQYNSSSVDSTGNVEQTVSDGVNFRKISFPLNPRHGNMDYFTINPSIELRNKWGGAFIGAKIPLKNDYVSKPSIFFGGRLYLGRRK